MSMAWLGPGSEFDNQFKSLERLSFILGRGGTVVELEPASGHAVATNVDRRLIRRS